MKKYIISSLMIVLAIAGLMFLTGCEKENSKNYTLKSENDEFSYEATVKLSEYDVTSEIEAGETDSVRIENSKDNYVLDLYLDGLYESAYKEDLEDAKESQTNFTETKFGKYSGYTYEDSEGDIVGVILLDSKDQYRNIKIDFMLYLNEENSENSDVKTIYNSSDIQNILNNVEYKSSK